MKKAKSTVAKNSREIAAALGITSGIDQAMMEHKAQISALTTKAIEKSGLSVNEIVASSGVARSKVSAIRNGALAGISIDLFMRVLLATGSKLSFKVAA